MSNVEKFKELAIAQAKESLKLEAFEEMTDEDKIIKGMSILVSRASEFAANIILEVSVGALRDSNFGEEAELVQDILNVVNEDL